MTEPKFKLNQLVYGYVTIWGERSMFNGRIESIRLNRRVIQYRLSDHADWRDESDIFASKEDAISNEIAKLELDITELKLELDQVNLKATKND